MVQISSLVFGSIVVSALATPQGNGTCPTIDAFPWCNYKLPAAQRAAMVVANLSVQEKTHLFVNSAGPVSRIKWPAYNWWSEALHGVARDGIATSFPQICGVAASGNRTLWNTIGDVTSTEGRGKNNNVGSGMYHGLSFWAPNVNIFRDPRWGRGEETPGEDPTINGEYAKEFVSGMQGDESSGFLKVSSCLKHYAAYNLETGRNSFPAMVTSQDMQDTYLPAFEAGVTEGKASAIMCSYNAESYGSGIFGTGTQGGAIPSCANKGLLNDLARAKWGFNGYITSDCGAVGNVQNNHHYTNNTQETVQAVLTAGMDTDCGGFMSYPHMATIYEDAELAKLADTALEHLFTVQFRLGFGAPDNVVPWANYGMEVVNTTAHQELALSAAEQSLVLMKNEGDGKLPWKSGMKVAVIGREANATSNMLGNYFGTPPYIVSPLEGISTMATTTYADGKDMSMVDAALKDADAVVLVVGLQSEGARPADEAEGHDRKDLLYPDKQLDLIQYVANGFGQTKPVSVVTMGGGVIDVSEIKSNATIDSLIWCGYPGQSGGTAIANAIFGKTNKFGKLTLTWYPNNFTNQVSIFDMGMRPNKTSGNPGRTYRFYTGTPVYKFGEGLSYTTFNTDVSVTARPMAMSTIVSESDMLRSKTSVVAQVTASVTNTGEREGDEVVQIFASGPKAGVDGTPLRDLIAFDRVHLQRGQSTTLTFDIKSHEFTHGDDMGRRVSQSGTWKIWAGINNEDKAVTIEL